MAVPTPSYAFEPFLSSSLEVIGNMFAHFMLSICRHVKHSAGQKVNLPPVRNRTKLLDSVVPDYVLRNAFIDELGKGISVDTGEGGEGRNANMRNIARRRREILLSNY